MKIFKLSSIKPTLQQNKKQASSDHLNLFHLIEEGISEQMKDRHIWD